MYNIVRQIRGELKLNQSDFARELGKSTQMIRLYEQGTPPPPAVVERLKTLCAEHALADLALALTAEDWQVQRVIHPAERPIGAPSHPSPVVQGKYNPRNKVWHDMLEVILESGDQKAIDAVQPNLIIFHAWVAGERSRTITPQKRASRTKKTG